MTIRICKDDVEILGKDDEGAQLDCKHELYGICYQQGEGEECLCIGSCYHKEV